MPFSSKEYFDLVYAGKFEEALDYRASFIPDCLYKFVSLSDEKNEESIKSNERKLETLSRNQLWLAPAVAQNDPYEFQGIYLDKDALMKMGVHPHSIEHTMTLFLRQTMLASFTENMNDNLPMWAHYANNHRGYCVEYLVNRKRCVRNVIYEPNRIPISKLFVEFLQFSELAMKDPSFKPQANRYATILQDIFYVKHISWSYEKEYRFLYPTIKPDAGVRVDLSTLGLSVAKIYSGINCSESHKSALINIASKLNVPYQECYMSSTKFTVME